MSPERAKVRTGLIARDLRLLFRPFGACHFGDSFTGGLRLPSPPFGLRRDKSPKGFQLR